MGCVPIKLYVQNQMAGQTLGTSDLYKDVTKNKWRSTQNINWRDAHQNQKATLRGKKEKKSCSKSTVGKKS